MKRALLDALNAARVARQPAVLATRMADGAQALFLPEGAQGDAEIAGLPGDLVTGALAANRSGPAETPVGEVFLHVFNPPLRLLVVGAVHITQALAPLAGLAGYEVTVIDPRRAFATDDRFPDVAVTTDWPDEAMARLAPDGRTAVVTLSHDPKLDDPALHVALASPAFYIGCLGSRRTHGARLDRLTEAGFDGVARARIHGPVGLNIGARSPAEIAISIMAQITATLHGVAAP